MIDDFSDLDRRVAIAVTVTITVCLLLALAGTAIFSEFMLFSPDKLA